jgi:hypothetical protein
VETGSLQDRSTKQDTHVSLVRPQRSCTRERHQGYKMCSVGRSEQKTAITPPPPQTAPSSRKIAPMVRATGLNLGPLHGVVRAAGWPFEKSQGPASTRTNYIYN